MNPIKNLLEIKELGVSYGVWNHQITILENFDFSVKQEEIVTLLGPSGCGKTTLLNCIAGFQKIQRGEINIAGQTVHSIQEILPAHERRLGMVFQDHALFPHLNVYENIVFALSVKTQKRDKDRIDFLIEQFKLQNLLNQYPHEISGGQQQRVALARSIAPKPKLILMDEPFASQDVELKEQVMDTVVKVLKHDRMTALIVTHDQMEAFSISDQMGIMKEKRLDQYNRPDIIYHFPETKFVADFIGHGTTIKGRMSHNLVDCGWVKFKKYFFPQTSSASSKSSFPEEGAQVLVFIRPDKIRIVEEDHLKSELVGKIVTKKFKGSNYLYGIKIDLGGGHQSDIIWSSMPSLFQRNLGDQVKLELVDQEVILFKESPD